MDNYFDIAEIIFAHIRGTANALQERKLQEWLKESAEHQRLFEQLQQKTTFQNKQKIYQRFDNYYNYKALQKRIRYKRILFRRCASAAIIVLLLSIGGLLYWNSLPKVSQPLLTENQIILPGKATATLILPNGEEKKLDKQKFELNIKNHQIINQENRLIYEQQENKSIDTTEIYHEIKVPRGGEYQVTLADGTQVWLNAESSIRYPMEFKGKQRKVWIQGELYFQVAQDSLHPFVIHHQNLNVQVLGTEFNVRAYADEADIQTTLVNGKVQVKTMLGESYTLSPSQQLIFSKNDARCSLKSVNTELYTSWKNGIYMFKSQRLEDILNLISRWYDVSITYQDQSVKDITFSGRLKRYEQAQTLLKVFEELGDVKFVVIGNHIIVEKKKNI